MAKTSSEIVSYIRVSTQQQGVSGLGLEAQQAVVAGLAQQRGCAILAEYREVETGKRADRPQLEKALAHAKAAGATLCIAKLDRLARNTRFLLTLVESGADLAFGDLPHIPGASGKFVLTMLAAVAELEAGMTSERTKAARKAAKARGVILGGYRAKAAAKLDHAARTKGGEIVGAKARAAAISAYADLLPTLLSLRAEKVRPVEIARRLNNAGHTTRRGSSWTSTQVKRVLDRASA